VGDASPSEFGIGGKYVKMSPYIIEENKDFFVTKWLRVVLKLAPQSLTYRPRPINPETQLPLKTIQFKFYNWTI